MKRRIIQMTLSVVSLMLTGVYTSTAQTSLYSNPTPNHADWMTDVTVLVIAPNGTWGTASEPFFHRAFAKAITICKSKDRHEIGCGYRSTSIRAGWTIAMRCGKENIIIAAKTLRAAEQAAVDSEFSLRQGHQAELPPCIRVVSIEPSGGIIAPNTVQLLQLVTAPNR